MVPKDTVNSCKLSNTNPQPVWLQTKVIKVVEGRGQGVDLSLHPFPPPYRAFVMHPIPCLSLQQHFPPAKPFSKLRP